MIFSSFLVISREQCYPLQHFVHAWSLLLSFVVVIVVVVTFCCCCCYYDVYSCRCLWRCCWCCCCWGCCCRRRRRRRRCCFSTTFISSKFDVGAIQLSCSKKKIVKIISREEEWSFSFFFSFFFFFFFCKRVIFTWKSMEIAIIDGAITLILKHFRAHLDH